MDLTKRYEVHKDKITYRVIDCKAVVLNLDSGQYYCLNETGTRVLELLQKKHSVREAVDLLSDVFRIPRERVHADVIEFLKDLLHEKIITESV